MVKIIETNILSDEENNIHDHQSRIIKCISWNEYVNVFKTLDDKIVYKNVDCMVGNILPSNVIDILYLKYDNFHLSCKIVQEYEGKIMYTIKLANIATY